MKYIHVVILTILFTLIGCERSSEKNTPVINAELALSSEDRQLLQKEDSVILKKIDKKQKLSIEDIKKMSKAGLSNTTIIAQIIATQSQFSLTSAEIADLKKAGVSSVIINRMNQTKKP